MSAYMPMTDGQAPRQRTTMYTPHGTAAGAYSPLQPQALDTFFDPGMTARPTYAQPPTPYTAPANANIFPPNGFGAHAGIGPTPLHASPAAPRQRTPHGYAAAQTPYRRPMPTHAHAATTFAMNHQYDDMYAPAEPPQFFAHGCSPQGPPSVSGASLYSEPRVQDVTGQAHAALFGAAARGSTPLAAAGALVPCAPSGASAMHSRTSAPPPHATHTGGGDGGGGGGHDGGGDGDFEGSNKETLSTGRVGSGADAETTRAAVCGDVCGTCSDEPSSRTSVEEKEEEKTRGGFAPARALPPIHLQTYAPSPAWVLGARRHEGLHVVETPDEIWLRREVAFTLQPMVSSANNKPWPERLWRGIETTHACCSA
jgi:hypothetical protein